MNMAVHPALLRPATLQRHDIYRFIHKALRARLCQVLVRVGSLDIDDTQARAQVLTQVDGLLAQCRAHVQHENDFVHAAMQARQGGSCAEAEAAHGQHLQAIAALQAASQGLRAQPDAASALALYQHLALFVAENLAHMHLEETAHNAVLWANYSDEEIRALEQRLHASLSPAEMEDTLPWLAVGLNPAERAELFGALQQQLPPEPFAQVLARVRSRLDDRAWARLARDLGLPPVPGLVTV
ncbi:hypothetical protein BurJ1DRAFT_1413 [Burkholderiales bacterium JOSHI_001]|nr:hypothetical protein BurJ1DRAFT_1413 [Burkholderiales bacterium JOSHI_001]